MAKCSSSYFVPSNCWLLKILSGHAFTNEHSFLAHEAKSYRDGWEIRLSSVNNGKFVINF